MLNTPLWGYTYKCATMQFCASSKYFWHFFLPSIFGSKFPVPKNK